MWECVLETGMGHGAWEGVTRLGGELVSDLGNWKAEEFELAWSVGYKPFWDRERDDGRSGPGVLFDVLDTSGGGLLPRGGCSG